MSNPKETPALINKAQETKIMNLMFGVGAVVCVAIALLVFYPRIAQQREAIKNCPPGQLVSTGHTSAHWALNTKRVRCLAPPKAPSH